ncbi:alpha-ketoacid dehydrogenase subunit beta [Agromyces albus]|uniref:Alpha-ketoacid dehydrogenase subunit beta n=1 Tax=Agromyces albus TaxID=205332 RepID=A0A4Q2KNE9_9MICO|nr:alpha-ketoacid dehydrogenase subunit beta [Agromyces albus]
MNARTEEELRVTDATQGSAEGLETQYAASETTATDAASTDTAAVASAAPSTERGVPGVQTLSLAKAITAGLREAMRADDKVLLMGEDIGPLGGVFRVTEGLQAEFGDKRVLDTPLAESGIVGTAIGLAMRGYRPVIEIQFDGFIFPAFDQITTQLARVTVRHNGSASMPIVIRVPYGGHIGSIEHHQESPEAYFAHTPGLRVVSPSNPHDAYWMIQEAIASNDPVLFFEPKSRYWPKGPVDQAHAGLPLHASRIVREGTDVTVVGHGAMVATLLQAADIAAEEGRSLEVVDLRSLSPIDYGPLLDSVHRTGRLIVAQEAYGNVSIGSEVAATVAERAFYSLEAPVLRVSSFDTPFPPAALESEYLPSPDRVLEAVDRALAY